jgi:hypothetical protein
MQLVPKPVDFELRSTALEKELLDPYSMNLYA